MRKDAVFIQFGGDKLIVTKHVQPTKIAEAKQYVQSVLDGDIGFGYRRVMKYELHGIGELRCRLKHTQLKLMATNTLSQWEQDAYDNPYDCQSLHVTRLRNQARFLKRKIKKHISFDSDTYLQFVKNYRTLYTHLSLLTQEGYIRSFTLQPTGTLYINWFSTWVQPDIDIIEYRVRSAESDRNIDGYNDWENSFYNLAYRTLGVDRTKVTRDYHKLWPQYMSSMHTGRGRGEFDVQTVTEKGGYDPDSDGYKAMHDATAIGEGPIILKTVNGKAVLSSQEDYVITVLAIALHTQKMGE